MDREDLAFQLALTNIYGIGDVLSKQVLAYCGSPRGVFNAKKTEFLKIPGLGEKSWMQLQEARKDKCMWRRIEEEIRFIEEAGLQVLFFTDEDYPSRMKYCPDSPLMMFYKGNANLNAQRVVAVVGTRNPTPYGMEMTKKLVQEMQGSGILVVSGMAYGVDIIAHKTALDAGLDTVGVLAHGHDRLYPALHEHIAMQMYKQGGLLTEYWSETLPERERFPERNRIVAGMCDALVVVESKLKGGSLITAEIANSYNKDVFAFPGRSQDPYSEGCNGFIKRNKAVLIEHTADLYYAMGWEEKEKPKGKSMQLALFHDLSEAEQGMVDLLKDRGKVHLDEICFIRQITVSEASALLLQLEFANIVKSLPGKMYGLLNS